MSEEKNGKEYASVAFESGAKKLGENIANRALDYVVDTVKKQFRFKKVELGTVFYRYLENAAGRYNKVRTLATGNDPRNIIGENDIYVKIGVGYNKQELDTSSVANLTAVSKNIVIIGTGGVGKSMLMRYLFLNTAFEGGLVPVLVELRKVGLQKAGSVSVERLIEDCMAQFDITLPEDEFIYSLRLGKYLFLFDGFDEVREELAPETADKIQEFCSKYPNNKCILTSRPTEDLSPLETFTHMRLKHLSKEQAVELASKIWNKDEKTEEFCRQLDRELFEKHQSFAENPLLLSMMFLTFMRNLSIPDHLAEFYEKAYSALYSLHDNHDKGYYRRDFRCAGLDERSFKLLFARFCFQTCLHEAYEFREAEILGLLRKCAEHLGCDIDERDYLTDLKKAVCMIVEDGNEYKFSHRSFQSYFAAVYASERLSDEQQKKLFKDLLSNSANYHYESLFDLLDQIEHERFTENALEDGLRELQKVADAQDEPEKFLLTQMFRGLYQTLWNEDAVIHFEINRKNGRYNYELLYNFMLYASDERYIDEDVDMTLVGIFIRELSPEYCEGFPLKKIAEGLQFEGVDRSEKFPVELKKEFYNALIRYRGITKLREDIRSWLGELDRKRAELAQPDFIDSL
ncbi:MAG: NACHT domain-containing protein [Ruminococcus sp.]|nr:NACHT domain-containing protein [Ruminococcus sp.]